MQVGEDPLTARTARRPQEGNNVGLRQVVKDPEAKDNIEDSEPFRVHRSNVVLHELQVAQPEARFYEASLRDVSRASLDRDDLASMTGELDRKPPFVSGKIEDAKLSQGFVGVIGYEL